MSNTSTLATEKKFTWGGGKSPFSVSYGKLMMWIFLLSDAFTFSSLLTAYGFIRHSFPSSMANELIKPMQHLSENFVEEMQHSGLFSTAHWPLPELVFNHFPFIHGMHLPLFFVSLMTFILIFSSVTMVLAVEAGHRMAKKEVAFYMFLTILGGLGFLSCQAWEWTIFITEGASLHGNPFGPTAFAALFFIVTGFHGFHVFSGVMINVIIYLNVLKGTYEKRGHYEMVEKVGLYWHFVDLVWVFVFTFFYLI
ncbi:MAG: cytochrome c oxidase subunit 3 [Bacteroidia bacterium]|jgi:cytochrome c oxidase subunit 3